MVKQNYFKVQIKQKWQSCKKFSTHIGQGLRTFFIEFCDNSNIHGVRYFSERLLHWSERIWWLIAFGVSVWFCGSMIHNIWVHWRNNPVTMNFAEENLPISTIPFPTVTICPEIKTNFLKFRLSSALKSYPHISDWDMERLIVLAHICPLVPDSIKLENNFTKIIYETMKEVAPDTFLIIPVCRWQNSEECFHRGIKLRFEIKPIFTDEGICYSFNALNSFEVYTNEIDPKMMFIKNNPNATHWNLEDGYMNDFDENSFPIRVRKSGRNSGLDIQFSVQTNEYEYRCKGVDQGFKVIFTMPGDSLKLSKNSLRIPLEEDARISIKPKLIITSNGLRNYSPIQRQCFYQSERQLRFFKIYTQSNCETECLANFTKIECGCVKFSMPRDRQTQICGEAKIKCYNDAEKRISIKINAKSIYDECNCLPACTSIEYNAQIDRVPIEYDKKSYRIVVQSRLNVFFGMHLVETIKRMEMYTFSDFMAICGGLLGLFLGISALSIVELIYYTSLRLFCNIRRERLENTVISPEHKIIKMIPQRFMQFIQRTHTFLAELCKCSNIHGVRYFTERTLHWSERFWWIIFFGLSIWLCGSMTRNIWMQWHENPVKMNSIEETSISTVPFPSVTICPEVKVYRRQIDLSFFSINNLRDKSIPHLYALFQTCPILNAYKTYIESFERINLQSYSNDTIYALIEEMSPQFDDTMFKCWWQGKEYNCSKYFVPVITEEGICFAFNAINSHEIYTDEMAPGMMIVKNRSKKTRWSLENGYENEFSSNEYPIRASDSGRGTGLDVSLIVHPRDFHHRCDGNFEGFKVILSLPGETMKISQEHFRVPPSHDTLITIQSKLTTTSDGLLNYKPNQRQCFYQSERQLYFFKMYTQTNCEAECLANFTAIECGCVKFSMPRESNVKICGPTNVMCYKAAETMLLSNESLEMYRSKCNCLPSCISIEYTAIVDRIKFDTDAIRKISGIHKFEDKDVQLTKLSIFFKDQNVETIRRTEVYTFADILAICGGLFGLFLGVSLLSIIELIYCSTLRWYWIIRREKMENMIVPFDSNCT